jgi:ABC-type transport system substrate-binding protein
LADYWNKVLQGRLSRRRAILATSGAAAGAAFLAACGGDDGSSGSGGGGKRDTSGLLNEKADTSAQAKRGGNFVFNHLRDPLHFDGQAQGQVQLNVFNGLAYESLVRNKAGLKEPSSFSEIESQLAESWEVSPDKLTLTFKLRQGVKWHNKAPVNGRAFDSSDVIASWNRYVTLPQNNRAANANSVNPAAPILSVDAPDARTVVVKLSGPSSYIFQRFANMITGELGSVYPREVGGTFDPRNEQIGTGPFMLDRFNASSDILYKRNPDYWNDQAGFFDEIRAPLVSEYATQLAQFKAGALSAIQPGVAAQDIITTKREVPALNMVSWVAAANSPGATIRFNWNPIGDKKSPFLDQRVRQALSMSMDRETYIDVFYNVSKFESEGLPVNTYWYTAMGYVPEWTLDPRGRDFGENAKYFEYNVAEAKKLIQAAESAYGGSFPEVGAGRVNAVFGAIYSEQVEVMDQFARDIGLKVNAVPLDYNIDYLTKIVTKQGKYEVPGLGWAYALGAVSSPDVVDYYVWRYYSKSGATSGALGYGGPDGSLGDLSGDPAVDSLIDKAKEEFDVKKRQAHVHDLQRVLAKQAYSVSQPGLADQFWLAWPAISNWGTFQGDSRVVLAAIPGIPRLWYDSTKPHRS